MRALTVACLSMLMGAAPAAAHTLTVKVAAKAPARGQVVAALFDSEEDFLRKPISTMQAKFTADGAADVVFSDLATGDYAVVVIHDENEDGKMNRGLLGFPKEAYAFSKNIIARFRRPNFDEAKVAVASDAEIEVVLDAASIEPPEEEMTEQFEPQFEMRREGPATP